MSSSYSDRPSLRSKDVEIIMEGIPNLLDLQGRVFAIQIPFSKMGLSEGEIDECPASLAQDPVNIRVVTDPHCRA